MLNSPFSSLIDYTSIFMINYLKLEFDLGLGRSHSVGALRSNEENFS